MFAIEGIPSTNFRVSYKKLIKQATYLEKALLFGYIYAKIPELLNEELL